MSQAPGCFPHMVSVLRSGSWHPRGKPGPGLEEILSGAPSRSDQAWLGGERLPISDLQHVPHVLHFHHFMLQPDLQ